MSHVLLIDADTNTRITLRAALEHHGMTVAEAATLADAETELRARPPDLAIADPRVPTDGTELLPALKRIDERVPVVLLASDVSLDHAIRAVKQGAEHLVAKPVEIPGLLVIVTRILESQRSRRKQVAIHVREHRTGIDPFVGTSHVIRTLADQAHRVLDSHAPILVTGETGTGKGVLAAWLHHHGPRADEAFVDINCAGFSRDLIESELFGHERGAFTGANAPKLGLLDVAHRGTAFLDEIGEIDLQLQPRLLKVLEEKRFRRLGDVRDRSVDIRLIAATNRDLARRAREGTFRADLYYRINTISLSIPSLRQRREDIPLLAQRIANSLGHEIDFSLEATRALQAYDWPGNVRELRNVIDRAVLISNRAPRITPDDLRFDVGAPLSADPTGCDDAEIPCSLEKAEQLHVERVMRFERGHVERAAVRLGISRSTLYQKLRRYREAGKLQRSS